MFRDLVIDMKLIPVICSFCNSPFEIKAKHFNYKIKHNQTRFYCSKKCFHESTKCQVITKICLGCNIKFNTKSGSDSPKCCSRSCSAKYSQSFSDPTIVSDSLKKAWKRGDFNHNSEKLKKYKKCPTCDNKFYGNKIYCSLLCLSNSDASKKISSTRKQMFRDGTLTVTGGTTKWICYKNIKVQGSYEFRTCRILDNWIETNKIKKWEYAKDRFQYVGLDEKLHNYLVDFKVWDTDNTFYYIEVKGYQKPTDELKWNAVKIAGFKLEIWFENDILKAESC